LVPLPLDRRRGRLASREHSSHYGAHAEILGRRWAVVRSVFGTGIFGADEGCGRLLAPMIDRCRGEDLLAERRGEVKVVKVEAVSLRPCWQDRTTIMVDVGKKSGVTGDAPQAWSHLDGGEAPFLIDLKLGNHRGRRVRHCKRVRTAGCTIN
jgi:hypothetical protein